MLLLLVSFLEDGGDVVDKVVSTRLVRPVGVACFGTLLTTADPTAGTTLVDREEEEATVEAEAGGCNKNLMVNE